MTPHISAKKEDIADFVIMPGDPLRAKIIAEKFLKDYKLVNEVRNMLMYTGYYKGVKVTIAGSGMGIPSIGIYSYELFKFYDVNRIVRVGSAGSYDENLKVYDIANVWECYSESNFAKIAAGIDTNEMTASKDLFDVLKNSANNLTLNLNTIRAHSSDVFYRKGDSLEFATQNNLQAVEMESFALFTNARVLNKQAACLLTISDSFVDNKTTTPEERQNNFMDMIKIALEAAVIVNEK